jgi:hypothetical protein
VHQKAGTQSRAELIALMNDADSAIR